MGSVSLKGTEGCEEVEEGRHGASSVGADMPFLRGELDVTFVIFLLVYFGYSRRVERRIWAPDPKRPTPAHMYMDGVEFFLVSRFVPYGFQWNSIKPYGSIVTSSTGTKVALLYPQVYDLLASLPRKTQIAAGVR
jgi:carbon starvation protein